MTSLQTPHKALLGIAILSALTYLLVPFEVGSYANILQKSSACLLLAALVAWVDLKNPTFKMLILALVFSSLGDAFLAIRSSDYFQHGLGSFLIAHLIYIAIFSRARNWSIEGIGARISVIAVPILACGMLAILWPELGALKVPVFFYIAVISLMVMSAILSNYPPLLAITGALSFLISDAVIAINKFLYASPFASPFIWVTYVTAQVLLTLAILSGPKRKRPA